MKRFFLSLLFVLFGIMSAFAQKFYDSKSQIIGISGDLRQLVNGGFSGKYYQIDVNLPIETRAAGRKYDKLELLKAFERDHTGKKILDLLFQYNGHSLSEDQLKYRAMQNVQLMDDERAQVGVIDKQTILREDYLPILQNNYIFLTRSVNIGKSFGQILANELKRSSGPPSGSYDGKGDRYRVYWIVFRVNINKETLDQVFNCWSDMDRYNQIDVPIDFVASGSYKVTDAKADEVRNLLIKSVTRKVEAFAIRGQVTDNHPLTVNIGNNHGIKHGDRFHIYRQSMNDAGGMRSTRVATARAGMVDYNSSRLYAVSGSAASYKKGDIAVMKLDRGLGHSITYNMLNMEYDKKYKGVAYTFDKRLNFSKLGISTYFLTTIGVMFDKFEAKWNHGIEYDNNTTFLDPGIGVGLGKTFFSRIEVMPYARIHYMLGLDDEEDYDYFSEAIKVPIGVKININLFYPLQLTLGAEYNLMWIKDSETWGDSDGGVKKAYGLSAGLRVEL